MSSNNTLTCSSPASSRTKRGRPRLQKSELTQTERRRAQVREAQRTYRMKKETAIRTLQSRVTTLENSLANLQTSLKKLDRKGGAASSRSAGFYVSLISQIHDEMNTIIIEALTGTEEAVTGLETNILPSNETEELQSSAPTPDKITTPSCAHPNIKGIKTSENKRKREESSESNMSESVLKAQKHEDKSKTESQLANKNEFPKIKIEPQDYDVPFLLSPSSISNSSSPLYMPDYEENSYVIKALDPLLMLIKSESLDDNTNLNYSAITHPRKILENSGLPQHFDESTNANTNNFINNINNTSMQFPLSFSDTSLGLQGTCSIGDGQQLHLQQQQQQQQQQTALSRQHVDIIEPASPGFADIHQRILAADSFDLFAL